MKLYMFVDTHTGAYSWWGYLPPRNLRGAAAPFAPPPHEYAHANQLNLWKYQDNRKSVIS